MRYRFGVFELDEEAGELRRAGRPVAIQPKPFALLRLLLRERGRVVSADELMRTLWPDTVVSPASLNRAVSHARRAIDDSGRAALLRSVSRRGYRFVGEVVEIAAAGDASAPPAAAPVRVVSAARAPIGGVTPQRRVFVGREEALAVLVRVRDGAAAGRSGVVLVRGPAGIGKTRLCEVFADEAEKSGFLTVVARCQDREGMPAYWLWAQVLRRLIADDALRAALVPRFLDGEFEALGPAIATYVPDVARQIGLPRALEPAVPAEQQRFRFLDAGSRALAACAGERPLLLVLEDLQWAGAPSLRLLEHVAAEVVDLPLLIVASVRDEPRDRAHPIDRTLAALRRLEGCSEVALGGLSRAEVGLYLSQVIGRPAPADLTSELFARTEGVPFFVGEALRLLDERGDLRHPERIPRRGVLLPARAVDLILRSLGGLSTECAELLGAASVIGREFGLGLATAVAQVPRERVLDLLDGAVRAGIVEECDEAVASYRFSHALFQEAIYDGLAAGRRARLHQRAAARLEQQHAGAVEHVLAELAHHHHRSIAVGDPERAFEFALRAARQAERVHAYEQAALHYEQAADALEQLETLDPLRRLETLLALGEAHRLSGERDRRIAAFEQAMEVARALGRRRDFARAAIGYCEVSEWSVHEGRERVCVEEALAGVDPEDSIGRARLTTRLAYLSVQRRARAEPLGREAVRLARESGDPEALQEALYILHYIISGPDDQVERIRMLDELVEAAGRCANRDTAAIALLDVSCDRLMQGDAHGAKKLRARVDEIAGPSASPVTTWHTRVWETGLALLEGRFDEVQQRAHDALLTGLRVGHPFARTCFNGQLCMLARERGEHVEVLRRLERTLGNQRRGATRWAQAVVGRAAGAVGDPARARGLLDEIAAAGFTSIARNLRWNGTLVEVAMLTAELAAVEHAKPLLELLATAEDQHGLMPVPILYGGPFKRCMAALSLLLGRADEAIALYDEALAAAAALGARPTVARIALECAPLLARSGDLQRARTLLAESADLAAELGMPEVEAAAGAQRGRW